jgi:hypothetical protein
MAQVTRGDTVILQAEFRIYEGGYIDPDDISVSVYDHMDNVIYDEKVTTQHRIAPGIYNFPYTVPDNHRHQLYFIFTGYINNMPIRVKNTIEIV